MTGPATRRDGTSGRRLGPRIAAVVLCAFGLNALAQGVLWSLGWDGGPTILGLEQWANGLVALAAAVGAWRHARWAAPATALYAVLVGTLVGTLGPVLDLPAEARQGMLLSAALVFVLVLGLAFYLWRALGRADAP